MLIDLLILILLILLNGMFAMTELAVVSARKGRLLALAESGSRRARAALALRDDPGMFLATLQIGITLLAILSGAYGEATLTEPLAAKLVMLPTIGPALADVASILVVIGITYFSLVFELVPKQIALRHADEIAVALAIPVWVLARAMRPLVWLVDGSNNIILRLMSIRASSDQSVSEEEVKAIIAEGAQTGVFDAQEKRMMDGVMRLTSLSVSAIMTHRQHIVWFEANETAAEVAAIIRREKHSHYVLSDGEIQNVVGIVSAKDLVVQREEDEAFDLRILARAPLTLPETTTVLHALESFRTTTLHLAIVHDEYGVIQGVVSLKDILEAIVGTLPEGAGVGSHPHSLQREDGSWLIDGLMPVFEVEELLGVRNIKQDKDTFNTLAGFVLHHLERLPREGDILEWRDLRFEIVDMDERRIDKLLVTRLPSDRL